jgi:hypothetical protein
MAVPKRKYDAAFKQEALRLLEISGKSVRQVEEELGITQGLLNKWKLWPVKRACRLLKVSVSGYYAWRMHACGSRAMTSD